ncbi:MAG TPA: HlyD family secretion protein, partial [Pseudomonadales bacterium]|nr:HlyD family secretion protein [Pseudomonadales bacterium]
MNAAVDVRTLDAAHDRTANGAATPSGEAHPNAAPAGAKPSRRTLLAAAVALLVAAAGVTCIVLPPSSETTDNAYVGADVTSVAPKVRGLVEAVLVQDNQRVHAGDPLVRIDPEEFDARVAAATADLADAQASVAAARAAQTGLDAEERLAEANVKAAQTSIRSANAQADRAIADRQRYDSLVANGSVSVRDAATIRAASITAEQDVARAIAMHEVAQRQASVTQAKRATLDADLQKSLASVARAQSALDLAVQDQRHASIVAPIDGVVGNRQVQVGDYVQPGSRLLTLVPLQAVYVTANFKETQTGRMRVGQRATVHVDALPNQPLTGVVDSLAPGSGSQIALLPFEPGTGNFTKIVQRVPVKIRFDAGQPGIEALRPGLSVTAKVTLVD